LNRAVLIEAFSEGPGGGNGAAVVLLNQPASAAWMQRIAGSLKQSETAFLLQEQNQWLLRWFTPSCEVPLCGHATLASLLALAHWDRLQPGDSLDLWTRSGALTVSLDATSRHCGSIVLPSGTLRAAPAPAALQALLAERLGSGADLFWNSSLGYGVALVAASAELAAMGSIAAALPPELRPGLVLMQPIADATPASASRPQQLAGLPLDFQLRFFAPGLGIEEDPVTGSAHALVAPWWQQRLERDWVVGWQCSDRPGGVVSRAASSGMIRLFGSGHLLWDGTLLTQPQGSTAAGAYACEPPSCDSSASWHALLPAA
jgi:PhzF family phenazine biosynthesis protein